MASTYDCKCTKDHCEEVVPPLRDCLAAVKEVLNSAPDHPDAPYFDLMGCSLRKLHARLRTHHAATLSEEAESLVQSSAPELSEDLIRLRVEHTMLMGMLDRIIRSAATMPDRVPDDMEVFEARVRELVSIMRRHMAEEDRLLGIAMWRDTGGES